MLAYFSMATTYNCKKALLLGPMLYNFLAVIYEFSHKAGVFVGLASKSLPGTNTVANYIFLSITDVKCFITLAPGVIVFIRQRQRK